MGGGKDESRGVSDRPAADASQGHEVTERGPTPSPEGFSRWFDSQLSRLYSDILSEPLPRDMLELVNKLKKADTNK
jgi:hypothetical protein